MMHIARNLVAREGPQVSTCFYLCLYVFLCVPCVFLCPCASVCLRVCACLVYLCQPLSSFPPALLILSVSPHPLHSRPFDDLTLMPGAI